MHSFNKKSTADEVANHFSTEIKGKNVLVTGCTLGGLGAEAARVIAKNGAALVILSGRNKSKIQATIKSIKEETPGANLRPLVMDLASLESVRKAATEVNAYPEHIDVLINNAAIMAHPFSKTVDGFEDQFGTNHLGPFLFTTSILPKIMASKSPRIVNVSSTGHRFSPIRFDDPTFEKGYNKWTAYGQAKTANMLFAKELSNKYKSKGLTSFSLHPGGIMTNLASHLDFQEEMASGFIDYNGEPLFDPSQPVEFKTVPEGTATHIVAAFDPEIASQTGSYLYDCQVANDKARPYALDDEQAAKLWTLSEDLVAHKA